MSSSNRFRLPLALAAVAVASLAALPAFPQSIGANFVGGQGGGGVAEDRVIDNADGPAGVISQSNWNNLTGNSGGPTALNDSAGAVTGASVTWGGSPNSFTVGNGSSTADHILMNGYLDTNNNSTTSVSVSNVPYDLYDVYVYFDGGAPPPDRDGQYTVNGTTLTGTDNGNPSGNFNGTFQLDDGVGGGGNYLLFAGLSDSILDISATPGGPLSPSVNRAPINGFQIVNAQQIVPEPASIAIWSLIGLGLVGFGVWRARRKT